MNQTSVENSISITVNNEHTLSQSSYSFSWNGTNLTIILPLDYGSIYNISIAEDASDIWGNGLDYYTWEFTTSESSNPWIAVIILIVSIGIIILILYLSKRVNKSNNNNRGDIS